MALMVLPVLSLAACTDTAGLLARKPVSVSFTATSTPRAIRYVGLTQGASLSLAPAGASFATAAAGAIVLDKVQLVLSHVELEKASASCTSTPTGSEGECEDIELDPTVVDITVGAAGTKTLATAAVPVGSYANFHATVDVVRPGEDRAAAFFAVPANKAFEGISVKVTGKDANGAAFTYTSTAKGEIETEFKPPLEVNAANAAAKNVTVEIDVSNWFTGVVNPASPTTTERALIDSRIRASLKAFEDDNKDGVPDTR
jgi:hypothetical protein